MKVIALVVLLCTAVVFANPEKRQLAALGGIVAPILTNALHLDKLVGSIVGGVTSLFKGKSGDITIPNSTLKLHYNIGKCHVKFGKRFIIGHLVREKCTATVSENAISKTSASCTEDKQEKALKCAMAAELKKIQALAAKA